MVLHRRKDGVTDTLLRVKSHTSHFNKVRVWNGEHVTVLERDGDSAKVRTRKRSEGWLKIKHLVLEDPASPPVVAAPPVVASPPPVAEARQWVRVWAGGFACYFGVLTSSERQKFITKFQHNRFGGGLRRKLAPCEQEMSSIMWVCARDLRDAQVRGSLKLAGLPHGERCRGFLNEGWCRGWAKHPKTHDQQAFHKFCDSGIFEAPPGKVVSRPANIPAGIMPCCTTEEGKAMVLLGRGSGWEIFQGKESSRDALEWDTAAREAAEEACEAFGSAKYLKERFFWQ